MTKRHDKRFVRSTLPLTFPHDGHRSADSMVPDGPLIPDITILFEAGADESCILAPVGMRSLIREHRKGLRLTPGIDPRCVNVEHMAEQCVAENGRRKLVGTRSAADVSHSCPLCWN